MDTLRKKSTIGVFAHSNAGKTTLTEQILYHQNVIDSIGRVDLGNTVTDFLDVERERGISVRASLVTFELENMTVQLIDTPGHIDFSSEVEKAINILDAAILIVSAVEGLEAQTYVIWNILKKKCVPVFFFINKVDRLGADYKKTILQLENELQISILPLHDIQVCEKHIRIQDTSLEDILIALSAVDKRAEDFFFNKDVKPLLVDNLIRELVHKCSIYPVVGGSALSGIGIAELVTVLEKYLPVFASDHNEFSAYVYNVELEGQVKYAYCKVLSGSVRLKNTVFINEDLYKVEQILGVMGNKTRKQEEANEGEIVIIVGLDVKCGDFIGFQVIDSNLITFVHPLLSAIIQPLNLTQKNQLVSAIKVLNEEDPHLNGKFDPIDGTIKINLMGEVQSQILETMLSSRFGIPVKIEMPDVIYRETIGTAAVASVSYTCVSGITLMVKPLPEGSGFVYISKLSTDYMHLKFQRQIEKLVIQYSQQGLYGWPLTDIEVSLIDGQFDSMGSEPSHFNLMTPIALFRCLKQAQVKLLEPLCDFTIRCLKHHLDTVSKNLLKKGILFSVHEATCDNCIIKGEAKVSEMVWYSLELSSLTAGRGEFSSVFSRYIRKKGEVIYNSFIGPDPRNEVKFVIAEMGMPLLPLDSPLMKKKKESRSKFKKKQRGEV